MEGKCVTLSDSDNKVLKKSVLRDGDNALVIVEGAECELEISDVCLDKTSEKCDEELAKSVLLNNSNFKGKWVIGKSTCCLDADVERCLLNMYTFEKSKLYITYFNNENQVALNVSCTITIVSVDESYLFCEWTHVKKLQFAKIQKGLGKELVTKNRIIEGFHKFGKALKILISLDKTEDVVNVEECILKEIDKLKEDLYNNLAYCQLQYNEYQAVVNLCDKALELNKMSEKALYRRGCALMGLGDYEAAYSDICQVLAIDPNNIAAKGKAAQLKEKVKHINENYKKVIKSMFV